MTEYKIHHKIKLGINDLISTYAFHGASQGDETRTNSLEDYNKSDGWLINTFKIDGKLTQEKIDKEVNKRIKQNEDYINQLKSQNKYGDTYEYDSIIKLEDDKIFNEKMKDSNKPTESYRFEILDMSKLNLK